MTFSHLVEFNTDNENRVKEFIATAKRVRGIRTVDVTPTDSEHYRRLYVNGSPLSERMVKGFLLATDFGSIDQNSDHDHEACIAHAASLGVPPSWAHTPETYLSM